MIRRRHATQFKQTVQSFQSSWYDHHSFTDCSSIGMIVFGVANRMIQTENLTSWLLLMAINDCLPIAQHFLTFSIHKPVSKSIVINTLFIEKVLDRSKYGWQMKFWYSIWFQGEKNTNFNEICMKMDVLSMQILLLNDLILHQIFIIGILKRLVPIKDIGSKQSSLYTLPNIQFKMIDRFLNFGILFSYWRFFFRPRNRVCAIPTTEMKVKTSRRFWSNALTQIRL